MLPFSQFDRGILYVRTVEGTKNGVRHLHLKKEDNNLSLLRGWLLRHFSINVFVRSFARPVSRTLLLLTFVPQFLCGHADEIQSNKLERKEEREKKRMTTPKK